jgi:hypothetical protein
MLIDHGVDLNITEKYGLTPLHRVCSDGHGSIVRMLIDGEADLNITDDVGDCTPLHVACSTLIISTTREVLLEIIHMLILAGADTQARDCRGDLPVDLLPAEDHQSRAIFEEAVAERDKPVLK